MLKLSLFLSQDLQEEVQKGSEELSRLQVERQEVQEKLERLDEQKRSLEEQLGLIQQQCSQENQLVWDRHRGRERKEACVYCG